MPSAVDISRIPTLAELGKVKSKGGLDYQITPNDLLWLGRSLAGEGGLDAATVWTYAQRIALYHDPSRSLAAMVQAHSQPVNPAWRRGGTFCGPGGRYEGDQRYCSERSLDARDRFATMPWTSVPADIRETLIRWAQADVPNPVPRATDFADPTVSQSFLNRNPDSKVVLRSGNWYIAEGGTARWSSDHVSVTYGSKTAMAAAGGGMLLVVGAAAAYWWFRGRRG